MQSRLKYLIVLLSLTVSLYAQSPYKQSYDVSGDNFSKAYHTNTLDSGMILITRSTNINGEKYFTIFKTLSNGDLQWSQRYVQPGNCNVSNIVQLPDSSYFFCFVELNFPEKYYIVHLDVGGVLIYCRSFTPPPDYIVAFDPTCIAKRDGHVYIQADLHDLTNGMFGWHLFEVDMNGNIVFSTCYNGSILKCLGRSFAQCANGDLVLAGYQRDPVSMEFGPVITRVDSDGVLLWSKLYLDTATSIAGLSIVELTNGNLVVTASHTTPGNEVIRLETDANGNLLRTREYGQALNGMSPYVSQRVENNSLLIYGTTDTGSFVLKLDSLGDIQAAQRFSWVVPGKIQVQSGGSYSFSGVDSQTNHALIYTTDTTLLGCFGDAIIMDTGSINFQTLNIPNSYAVQLFDTAFSLADTLWPGSDLKICDLVGIDEQSGHKPDIVLFPNPGKEIVSVHSNELILNVELYDALGRITEQTNVNSTDYTLQIHPHPPGMYLVRIQTENSVQSIRLIVE